jgi:hypothetical protein
MAKIYDEDGDEIQISDLEEFKVLEEKASKIEDYETQLKEKEAELEKYQSKEFNFSKLRGKSQTERDELLKEFSEKEKLMASEIDTLSTRIDEYHSATLSQYEADVLDALAGEDTELKDKIKERAKDFVGAPKTKADLLKRYKDSFTLLQGAIPNVNPINQFQPSRSSTIPNDNKKRFTESEKGKQAYGKWFPDSQINKK